MQIKNVEIVVHLKRWNLECLHVVRVVVPKKIPRIVEWSTLDVVIIWEDIVHLGKRF